MEEHKQESARKGLGPRPFLLGSGIAAVVVAVGGGLGLAVWLAPVSQEGAEGGEPAEPEAEEEVEEEAELVIPEAAPLPPSELERIPGESGEELLARLRRLGAPEWPPDSRLVPVTTAELPTDLAELRAEQRKEVFFRVLTPIVLAENDRLRQAREFVQQAAERLGELSPDEQRRLDELAAYYRVEGDGEGRIERLLHRLDEVPVSLALAQAANESGWGTSRFTREGNNLFGEWTWTEEGLVPEQREAGKTHRVRAFPSLRASVRSYLHNLNTHRAYAGFRERRAAMREHGEPLDGTALAGELKAYSERGDDYIEELRAMIRHNKLERLRGLRLAEGVPQELAEEAEAE